MKPQRWIPLLASGAILLIAMLAYSVVAPIEVEQEISDGTTVSISSGIEAGQVFTAHFPGLTEIVVATDGLLAGDLSGLQFRLAAITESGQAPLLSSANVRFELQAGWLVVHFQPLKYDVPQQFAFNLAGEFASPVTLKAHQENLYPEGTRTDAGGDLVFKARFRPSTGQTLPILAQRLASHKPGVLGSPWTYLILLTSLFFSLVGTTRELIQISGQDIIPGRESHTQTPDRTQGAG